MSLKLQFKLSREKIVLIVAVLVALAAVAWYLFSGRSNLDLKTRELQNSDPSVEQISVKEETQGQKTMEVKCKDGTDYDVYYPPGETNYDALAASKCQQ
jgi:hypothetical protein